MDPIIIKRLQEQRTDRLTPRRTRTSRRPIPRQRY
jgi:hypothetical protein